MQVACQLTERACDCAAPGLGVLITAVRLTSKAIIKEEQKKKEKDEKD